MINSNDKNKYPTLELNRRVAPNIVLIGGTASGKSTIGFQLAKVLELGIFDLDDAIERSANMKISEIFSQRGEDGFRDLESDIINKIRGICNQVVITGAGAVERDENWKILKSLGTIICLATPTSEIIRRLVMRRDELEKRPLLSEAVAIEEREEREKFIADKLDGLLKRRVHRYEEADIVFSSSYVTAETCAHFIRKMLISKT